MSNSQSFPIYIYFNENLKVHAHDSDLKQIEDQNTM